VAWGRCVRCATCGRWLATRSSDALAADVQDIADLGVDFRLGVEVGQDIALAELREQYDALLVAVGARTAKALTCPGSDLPGVISGLELLQGLAAGNGNGSVRFTGETVVVVGGGNVAIDVARTALRLDPAAVHLYCLEKSDEMPAHVWEVAEAEREGVVVHAGWGPARIVGQDKVERVEFAECVAVFNSQGEFAPRFDATATVSQAADRVLVAIGQQPALGLFNGQDGGVRSATGTIAADPATLQIASEDLFASGEVVTGPASVVTAVAQGRQAAASIDRRLGGDGDLTSQLLTATVPDVQLEPDPDFCARPRVAVPRPAAGIAAGGFELVEGGYSADEARQEADRCLRCDMRLQLRPNPAPPEPWLALTAEVVATMPSAEGVYQLLDEEKTIYAIKGVADLQVALAEIVESTSRARYFLYEEDPLFSKRESELNQVYLQQHGSLPPGEGDDDLDDLY
jgi:NADPH-dependent glutamate synthase beta subunit-like oxidoreductase